jgi:hypothetical protein
MRQNLIGKLMFQREIMKPDNPEEEISGRHRGSGQTAESDQR